MTTAGPNNPGSAANDAAVGTLNWASTSNVLASDNAYATVDTGAGGDATSKYLKVSDFGFSIPTGSTINGITISIESKHVINDGTGITTHRARIVKNGAIGSTNKTFTWSTTEAVQTLGGASDLWGESWTASDLNDPSTGFAIAVNVEDGGGATDVAYIDHITMTVDYTYTPPAPLTSEILRPVAGLDEFVGEVDWIRISEGFEYPDIYGHDGEYAYFPAGTSAGTNARKYRVAAPAPGYTITKATLYVWAYANYNTPSLAVSEIYSVRMKLNGTWYDLGVVSQTLGDTLDWFVFELPGLNESTGSSDIGFEIAIRELHGYVYQQANIDVAYLELQYAPASQSSGFFHWF